MAAPQPIHKVLVANRGEIARRVFAACRRMGIGTVAVHSEPDAEAPFVREADEAVALGGTAPAESYLRADAVIDAARGTGADAIHPGYGFLAENADFARATGEAGLVWIGPGPEAIEAMGSKVRARALMERAGVPVLPGVDLDDVADAPDAAERIGFPLLVKASAGGGGKGMRTVREPGGLGAAVDAARREAESAFGDGTLFLERLLERPRHVEIQVFADRHGNTVSLGERECSIQRRHQKVIEEAPSPAVDHELRHRMGEAAIAAAEAVGYVGAGTVEFLLGPDEEFFFLEMNTRLQVEHPVTEMVTGLDLVRLQVLVAGGERLPADLHAVEPRGHAVEARLYAEDPANDYLPQTGRLDELEFGDPAGGEIGEFAGRVDGTAAALRLDSGFESGDAVSPHYDPMLAKLVSWAPTRTEAVQRLAAALSRGAVSGPITNRDFLVRVLRHPEFLAGATDTGFLERHDGLGAPLLDEVGERLHAAAAALAAIPPPGERPLGFAPVGWRNNPAMAQRRAFAGRTGELAVEYAFGREGVRIAVDGEPLVAPVRHAGAPQGEVDLEVDGIRRRFRARRGPTDPITGAAVWHVSSPLGHSSLREVPRHPRDEEAAAEGALVAPMPGKVLKLLAAEGDRVEAGDVVAVLEAMKMEHELTAPAGGTLSELRVVEGEQVDSGAVLGVIEPPS
jgi:propionyl-CoA carboxylase alpha chain